MKMFDEEKNKQRYVGKANEYHFKINDQTENLSDIIKERRSKEMTDGMQKYMPIGSVITINGSDDLKMIIGFNYLNNQVNYDYIGCSYPSGIGNKQPTIIFNHDQIDKIYHVGYINNQEKEFKSKLLLK